MKVFLLLVATCCAIQAGPVSGLSLTFNEPEVAFTDILDFYQSEGVTFTSGFYGDPTTEISRGAEASAQMRQPWYW